MHPGLLFFVGLPAIEGYALGMRAVLAAAVPLVVIACTHNRPISELHRVAGQDVIVETPGHEDIQAVAIPAARFDAEAEHDGLTFASDVGVLRPSEVAKVTVVHRGRGALEGAGIGFLIGAASGAALGYADGDDECASSMSNHPSSEPNLSLCIKLFTAEEKALLGAAVIGGIGGLIGTIVGAVTGSSDVYSYGEQVRITPTGPPGSVGGVTIKY